MTTISFKVSDATARKLTKISTKRRVPKSTILRQALDKELRGVKDESSLYDLMKDGLGCFDSGKTDRAINPKYMKGFGKWRE